MIINNNYDYETGSQRFYNAKTKERRLNRDYKLGPNRLAWVQY